MSENVTHQISEFFREIMPALRAYAQSLLRGNNHAADEVLQESLLYIWEHREEFSAIESPRARAFRVIYFKSLSYRRDNARRLLVELPPELVEKLMYASETESGRIEKSLFVLGECVGRLTKADRRMLDLFYAENLSFREVANAAKKNEAAARQQICRLRRALRRCVEKKLQAD